MKLLFFLFQSWIIESKSLAGLSSDFLLSNEKLKFKLNKWSENENFYNLSKTENHFYKKYCKDNDRIFFHETSGISELNARQSCAVESAAFHNPDRSIQLFMETENINVSSYWLKEIFKQYDNIEINLINETKFFQNTPLENWYLKEKWRNSSHKFINKAQYSRIISMWRAGGFYMDLDLITLRRLEKAVLKNFFVAGHNIKNMGSSFLSDVAFHLLRGHRLINQIIKYMSDDYDPYDGAYNGISVITAALQDICGIEDGRPSTNRCHDVIVLPYQSFLPISLDDWEALFKIPNKSDLVINALLNGSKERSKSKRKVKLPKLYHFGVHTWNSKSFVYPLVFNSNQLYAQLANQHCPFTVNYFNNIFDMN